MAPRVENHPEADRYEIRDGDQLLGVAAYQHLGSTLVFTHTEVQSSAEHSGLGSTLVRAALDDARAQGAKVVAKCTFVSGWIDRHAEYADLLADPER